MDKELPKFEVLPRHVGIIMDGNGRWAKNKGLPRSEGHKAGAKTFRKIGEFAADLGIKYLTFYAFSTENWKRPEEEVHAIMDLFKDYLDEVIDRILENRERGIRLHFIGDRSALSENLRDLMEKTEAITADKDKVHLNIAINYGGRAEIVKSVREIAELVKKGELNPEDITDQTISDRLYTAGQPDPDLIIRPSGEFRLSNFLTYQSAYSEFWFSDILWPDFTEDDLVTALRAFEKRNRRFGGV
ncbi:MAG: isoprenyl transferase [Oscillospiraceae bacterium]|nr:isoprenyl transferase [Oscillospiraceae bacterium]MDY3937285.1 isoprenyl transferase [Oscillospiraceae bacterium]